MHLWDLRSCSDGSCMAVLPSAMHGLLNRLWTELVIILSIDFHLAGLKCYGARQHDHPHTFLAIAQ